MVQQAYTGEKNVKEYKVVYHVVEGVNSRQKLNRTNSKARLIFCLHFEESNFECGMEDKQLVRRGITTDNIEAHCQKFTPNTLK